MVRSFAQGRFVEDFLATRGIRPSGVIWRWHVGLQGGVYEEHQDLNRKQAPNEFAFPDHHHPDTDPNAAYCQCLLQTVWRDERGRFAPPSPVVAAMPVEMEQRLRALELAPNMEAVIAAAQPQQISVTIPDGAIVVNVPKQDIPAPEVVVNVPKADTPIVNVAPPEVNVAAPNVTVEAPSVTVEAPAVTVEAPNITVEPPNITLEPVFQPPEVNVEVAAPAVTVNPKVMLPPDDKRRVMRVLRDNDGRITGSEEVQ